MMKKPANPVLHNMTGFEKLSEKVSSFGMVQIIQRSLTILIPVLMIGAFSLIVKTFPIVGYQIFLSENVFGKIVFGFADMMYNATFGMLSMFMTVSISYCVATTSRHDSYHLIGTILTSSMCFLVSIGKFGTDFNKAYLGVNGMFMAIFASLLSAWLYVKIYPKFRISFLSYTDGANYTYNSAVAAIFPMLIVLFLFGTIQLIISSVANIQCVQQIFVNGVNLLFSSIENKFIQGSLFVLISSILWFFGIHGSDVLNSVNDGIFTSYIKANEAAVAAGNTATNITSKTFIDVFVLMGGCGVTLCLLLAILIFCKKKNNRRLAKTAAFPMLFNINELMVFGLPIIFKPIMLIPFIATPIMVFLTSYIAVAIGIVPVPSVTVEWTTPVLLSGYIATKSVAGSLLQLFNLLMGTLIYAPFVKMMEREQTHSSKSSMNKLISALKQSENENMPLKLEHLPVEMSSVVKMLMLDLQQALKIGKLKMFYQPQFDSNMKCIGAEALVRWNHSNFGQIYPPLIIKLAEEDDILFELEKYIFNSVMGDFTTFLPELPKNFKLSVNVSANTFHSAEFEKYIKSVSERDNFVKDMICIEITEQSALNLSANTSDFFKRIHDMGYLLAIDDFSMGHTSLKYLQDNYFDMVKLDGSLVKEMGENDRCTDIIKSILYLSQSLEFKVLAECVETKEQMESLINLGCRYYQGWLCNPALSKQKFINYIIENKSITENNDAKV